MAEPANITRDDVRLGAGDVDLSKVPTDNQPGSPVARTQARPPSPLSVPTKYWKFNPGDIDERALWPDYERAYEIALERTDTEVAPWHVIPADRKWYRNLSVACLLRDTLGGLNLSWPFADFDVAEQRARLVR